MITLAYGCRNGLHFISEKGFIIVLGVLANNKYTKVVWEHNEVQGAWGSEGRIQIYAENLYLRQYLGTWYTKGVGNILHRVNCNNYITYLNRHFGIQNGVTQSETAIRNIVQSNYRQLLNDFDTGFNS